MIDRYARFVAARPGRVLAAALLFTLLSVSWIVDLRTGTPRLVLDPSMDSMLPEDDDDRRFYDSVRALFGNDETLLVALSHERGVFTPERLGAVARLTERLEKVRGVERVVSLANALNIRAAQGELQIEPFLERLPTDAAEAAAVREEALGNPIYAGNLVSPDGRVTALLVFLQQIPDREFLERGVDREVRALAEEEADGAAVWVTGGALVKAETSRLVQRDLLRIVPLAVVVMAGIAAFSFRSLHGVVVPLATILIALLWSLGLIALTGRPLNIVTVVIPPLILVVGFAYAVHVVAESDREWAKVGFGGDRRDNARRTLREVALPVLLAGLTTAAGFLSLTTSPLGAIRQFGTFATVGVVCTLVASLTFAPALLLLLPRPRPRTAQAEDDRVDRWLTALAEFDLRHRRAILVAGALVAAISILAMTRIQVSTDLVSNFPAESRVRSDFEAVSERLEGAAQIYVVLSADYAEAFLEPVNLREVRALQEWLASQPDVGGSTSLVDYLMLINRGFHDGDPTFLTIPESKRLARQLLFFGANDEIDRYADSRYQTLSIRVRSRALDSGQVAALVDRIEARLAELPARIHGRATGNSVLMARTIDDIAFGQAVSLGVAFLIIYAILALLFTSLRVGLLALIPNALPVLVYFGALGVMGVTLNVTTGLVACLVLGIAVDDTLHMLARFNHEAKHQADEERGVIEALRAVGRPVTCTSFALALGFLVLTTATLRNQVEFGALASFTLLFAWVVDVTFTPAMAARMRIVTLWDVLTLDLGDAPHRSIPLFQGLSATQARITALMADVRTYPAGTTLFRAGEEGEDMYVVIDGRLAASVQTPDGVVQLSRAERGDVTGEVAMFHGKRTADVVAETEVRLIRFDMEDLNRLRRRYPRIAATLLRNLSQILAGRLAAITGRVR